MSSGVIVHTEELDKRRAGFLAEGVADDFVAPALRHAGFRYDHMGVVPAKFAADHLFATSAPLHLEPQKLRSLEPLAEVSLRRPVQCPRR